MLLKVRALTIVTICFVCFSMELGSVVAGESSQSLEYQLGYETAMRDDNPNYWKMFFSRDYKMGYTHGDNNLYYRMRGEADVGYGLEPDPELMKESFYREAYELALHQKQQKK